MTGLVCSLLSAVVTQPSANPPLLVGVDRTVALRGGGYFPVLIRAGSGKLIAVVRGGAGHLGLGGRLDVIESTDGGRSWSEPRCIVDSEWDDRNPALGEMTDGTLVLAYAECSSYSPDGRWDPSVGGFETFLTLSHDGGATWSEKSALPHPFGKSVSPYGRIIVTSDGTALLSIYGNITETAAGLFGEAGRDGCGILRSHDNGRTWGDFSPIARGYNETALLELPDGRLVALARSDDDQHVAALWSSDGGRGWSSPARLSLGSQHPADAALLANGDMIIAYGSRVSPYGVHVTRAAPDDDLSALPVVAVANDSSNTDQGYPSLVVMPDGTAVLLYYAVGTDEHGGDEMALSVRFAPDSLPRPVP